MGNYHLQVAITEPDLPTLAKTPPMLSAICITHCSETMLALRTGRALTSCRNAHSMRSTPHTVIWWTAQIHTHSELTVLFGLVDKPAMNFRYTERQALDTPSSMCYRSPFWPGGNMMFHDSLDVYCSKEPGFPVSLGLWQYCNESYRSQVPCHRNCRGSLQERINFQFYWSHLN